MPENATFSLKLCIADGATTSTVISGEYDDAMLVMIEEVRRLESRRRDTPDD